MRSSWARTASWVRCGFDRGEPDRTAVGGADRSAVGPAGRGSTQASITWSAACSTVRAQSRPEMLRHGWGEVADRLQHVGPGPGRAVGGELLDDTLRRRPRRRVAGRSAAARRMAASTRVGVQPRPRGFVRANATTRSRGAAWVLVARVSSAASRVRAARSQRVGSRPSRSRNSVDLPGEERRRPGRCAWRTRRAARGACRRSRLGR